VQVRDRLGRVRAIAASTVSAPDPEGWQILTYSTTALGAGVYRAQVLLDGGPQGGGTFLVTEL
jgi:hypothetical protein